MFAFEPSDPVFYTRLGALLHAVASADSQVHPYEVDTLRKILSEHLALQDGQSDSRSAGILLKQQVASQINKGFEKALEAGLDSEHAFDAFQKYYSANPGLFPSPVKNWIVDTSYAIANAAARINKSELILITRLKMLFWENS